MKVTTTHELETLIEAAATASGAVTRYLEANNYQVIERKGVIYGVHPDYVELFNSYYNGAIKGGWFGKGYDSPTWAAIRL